MQYALDERLIQNDNSFINEINHANQADNN